MSVRYFCARRGRPRPPCTSTIGYRRPDYSHPKPYKICTPIRRSKPASVWRRRSPRGPIPPRTRQAADSARHRVITTTDTGKARRACRDFHRVIGKSPRRSRHRIRDADPRRKLVELPADCQPHAHAISATPTTISVRKVATSIGVHIAHRLVYQPAP